MGKPTGFMEFDRELPQRRPVAQRVNDWFEIYQDFPEDKLKAQGARCMDCGVPFCHNGCPVNNIIPDWNDLVYQGRWKDAVRRLHATNNFPDFTGRICPAPCEAACVLGINAPPVTIKNIEKNIVDRGFDEGWIKPEPPKFRTGKKVAVVGSGPAGLAAAQQLNRAGHWVTVYEKADRIGGLLRYGIPNFKLDKGVLDRRLKQLSAEGIRFVTKAHVGKTLPVEDLQHEYDAILLAGGSEQPRDLPVPGRELKGIHFAMEFLPQQNRRCEGDTVPDVLGIMATGKHVVIIGGGDTGADCLGTSHRQKALSIHQFEIMPMPPQDRAAQTPWPLWPMQLRVESSHEEGGVRDWSIATQKFTGDEQGNVKQLHGIRVGAPPKFDPIAGTEFTLDADLVLLAMGFTGPVRNGMLEQFGVLVDPRGNVATDDQYATSVPGVFAAGDMRRGQSLVVWAIAEGRKAAASVDTYLKNAHIQPVIAAARRGAESVAVTQTSVCFGIAPVRMSGGFQFQAVISATPRHSPFKSFTLAAVPAVIPGAHLDQSIQHVLSQYNDQLPLQEASTIPAPWYTDPRIAELERRAVFGANWQCVARVEQVAQPGQYIAVQVAGEPVVVVRGTDGKLRAFFNVCRHHAAAVAPEPCGSVQLFRCSYHGWSYGLDGSLKGTPDFAGVCNFDRAENGLVSDCGG